MGQSDAIEAYLESTRQENRLTEVGRFLLESEDAVYYLDRHVEDPPQDLPRLAAGYAGICLLILWAEEQRDLTAMGLLVESPVLVIDKEWLDADENAPPPHVLSVLAKTPAAFRPREIEFPLIQGAESPIPLEDFEGIEFAWLAPWPGSESKGCWLFRRKLPEARAL